MRNNYRVFVSTNHPGAAISYLSQKLSTTCSGSSDPIAFAQLMDNIKDVDGVVSVIQDKFTADVLDAHPRLKVVANVAVGYDNIDVKAATERGVLVVNTPGVLDATTADLAFGLLLASARRIVEADKYVRAGKWTRWTFDLLLGRDLGGKVLGIVGLGRIGQAMARRAAGFDMKVVYTQRHRASAEMERAFGATYLSLDELLATSDFVSLHTPLNEQTRHLLSKREFELIKPGAIVVNTSRGAVIDEQALVLALQSGRLGGAGLDVFEFEPKVSEALLSMDNVVLAPHIGSASVETRSAMAQLAVDGLLSGLSGQLPANAVNPEVWPAFAQRLTQTVASS